LKVIRLRLREESSNYSGKAFSPGSATLFFIPNREQNLLKKGSKGVAICVETGITTKVEKSDNMDIRFNGIPIDNSIQEEVAKRLKFTGKIFSNSDLPPSSGFGLSAGAALTTLAAIMGGDSRIGEIYRIAHKIELRRGTGLGDVQSQIEGGFHVRLKGGSFPFSVTERILEKQTELVILPFRKKTPTGEIIRSKSHLEEIVKNGNRAFSSFIKKPSLKNAFVLGRKFATDSDLVSPRASKILEDLKGKFASVSLIGESIIAIYDEETMDILRKYGDPIKTRISATGLILG
jgi:pantoate kinase